MTFFIVFSFGGNEVHTQGESYEELCATATDNVDATVSVAISGDVNTSVVGVNVITYTATDSSASVSRVVNIKSNEPTLESLVLSMEKTSFVRKKEPHSNKYTKVNEPVKVMGIYSDGHSEEVTDKVSWDGEEYLEIMKVIPLMGNLMTRRSMTETNKATLRASIGEVKSNTLNINIEKEKEGRLLDIKIINYNNKAYSYPEVKTAVDIKLMDKPTSDVKLRLSVKQDDGVIFESGSVLSKELIFTSSGSQYERVRLIDINNTKPYTIITEVLESNDTRYEGKDPEDIVINANKGIKLDIPPLQERRGAIRGVTIHFNVFSDTWGVKYTLIDPPEGMKVRGRADTSGAFTTSDGIEIKWDVPMDAEEGKIYDITVRVAGSDGEKGEITFPIKVPKTKAIQTKLVNNELIVTDKSSNLYGMKMKGHSGENISELRLRSVEYGDVWKKKRVEKLKKYAAFIVYNKPPKVDFDFPELFSFYKYVPPIYTLGFTVWDNINRGYYEDDNGQFTIPVYREHDNGGNKVYFIYQSKKK